MKTVNWHVVIITYFTTRAMHIKIAGYLSIGKFMLVLKAIFCWGKKRAMADWFAKKRDRREW